MYYAHIRSEELLDISGCKYLDDDITNIEVTDDIFAQWCEDNDKLTYSNGEIIENPNYDNIKTAEREEDFKSKFIETSWGWYRKTPQGYANAPQSIDIILNMVNALGGFTDAVASMMIFYTAPNFADESQCTEEWLIANQYKHEVCTTENFMTFYIDFQTRWAQEQYASS